MKKLNRRGFLISTTGSAAGISFLGGCNSRTPIGPDVRKPSAPQGLAVMIDYTDQTPKQAILTWKAHDKSDVTGAPNQKEITGYNIYCNEKKINDPLTPVTSLDFNDTKGPDGTGFIVGATYIYTITAVDTSGNESPHSLAYPLRIKNPSPIYKITNQNSVSVVGGKIKYNAEAIREMVFTGIRQLSGKQELALAFESLFPKLSDATIIALKINTLAGGLLSTHPEVVAAVIEGLSLMRQGTFPRKNIVIFDDRSEDHMKGAGFPLQNPANDYKVISIAGETNANGEKNWAEPPVSISGSTQRLASIVLQADYIINMPVLKDHNQAGVTFAMKNFYGIIDNPGDMHKQMCDPYIAEIYQKVAPKVALIIGDALVGAYDKGPSPSGGPNFLFYSMLLGRDPVAMDMYVLSVINKERAKHPPLPEISLMKTEGTNKHADARHIETADSPAYNLGSKNFKLTETLL